MNCDIKANSRKYLQERMILTFGSVKLDPCIEKFSELGPNFAMMEDLDLDRIKTDFLISLTIDKMGEDGERGI